MLTKMTWLIVFIFEHDGQEVFHTHLSDRTSRQEAVEEARLHLTGLQLRALTGIRIISVSALEEYDTMG